MSGFPEELVLILIFGAVMLVQFLLKRWRQRGPQPEDGLGPDDEFEPEAESPPIRAAPPPPEAPRRVVERKATFRPAQQPRQGQRFARSTLMGNRRALQDAIVMATILGPCRAHRPHEAE